MATLNDLLRELTVEDGAEAEFLAKVKAFIELNGKGVYTISTEYGDYCISKDPAASLDEVRNQVQGDIDADADEDDPEWDYFADFNDDETPAGFLFGEGWYCVDITEI